MREAIDADFSTSSRRLTMKLHIYFDGNNQPPTEINDNNYLIDCYWLEEGTAESANPLGAIAANELSFSLHNKDGIFNPTNKSSIYYGKMKLGVKVELFIKPLDRQEEVDWLQLGVYFISSWQSTVTGSSAVVQAYDKLQDVFTNPTPNYPITLNTNFHDMFIQVFQRLGYSISILAPFEETIAYAFVEDEPIKFLQEMMQGAIAICTCNKQGEIEIIPMSGVSEEIRLTLRDTDQIKDIYAQQTATKSYNGIELTYALPQVIPNTTLLDLSSIIVPTGNYNTPELLFSEGPMYNVSAIKIQSSPETIQFNGYVATPWKIKMDLFNPLEPIDSSILIEGAIVNYVNTLLSDVANNLLKISNRYVQNEVYANKYKNTLKAFILHDAPILEASIRGNPLLNIGDRVRLVSARYNLDFTGILLRMDYAYTGGLSCKITVLNADIFREVT